MQEKPSLGYSLALYLVTVMWIAGTVGAFTFFGVDIFFTLKTLHGWQTIDKLDLSHADRVLARAEMEKGMIAWEKISRPIKGEHRFPISAFLCCFIGGAGYRIRKGMGEPVELIDLLR